MYHLLSAQMHTSSTDAADPTFAASCLDVVEETMTWTASELSRHLIERPRLVATDPNPLGLVTLTFNADTEDD